MRIRQSCRRRARLILLACVAFGVGAAGICVGARLGGAEDGPSLAARLQAIQQDRARVQEKLRGVKQRQHRVSRELAAIDGRLDSAEGRLRDISQRVTQAQVDLQRAARDCEAAKAQLAEHQVGMADRLVAIYKQGETRPLEVLLQSTSFADFANRLYLLDQIVGQDAELLGRFEESQAQADVRHAELEEMTRNLAGLRERASVEKQRTQGEREVTERQKRELLRDRAAWERALAELEQDSREVEAMLQRLQRSSDGKARAAQSWSGRLQRPVEGRVSSPFGYRIHPIYRVRKMHTGMDIAAASGTPISAAAEGTVVHAARWGGYGNCVIIEHAGGMSTLYAHCSRIAVHTGEEVRAGQTVAYVGTTGLSTGPHLHFEVRRNGRPVDPAPFL